MNVNIPLLRFYIHKNLISLKLHVLILNCLTYRNNKFVSIMGDTTCYMDFAQNCWKSISEHQKKKQGSELGREGLPFAYYTYHSARLGSFL